MNYRIYIDIRFGTANGIENSDISDKYNVTGFPTTLFFKDGKLFNLLVGFDNIEIYTRNIELLLGNISEEVYLSEIIKHGEPIHVDNDSDILLKSLYDIRTSILLFTGCYDDYKHIMRVSKKIAEEYITHNDLYFSISMTAEFDDDEAEYNYIIIDIVEYNDSITKIVRPSKMEYNGCPSVIFTTEFIEWSKSISGYETL